MTNLEKLESAAAKKLRLAIMQAKARRFTLSSRILTAKNINVNVCHDVSQTNPAWINMQTLDLTLNEAYPKTRNEIRTLVYDRAKLYHELGHALFTTNKDNIRDVLWHKSRNPALFLDVSNVLEDGRIERCMSERFGGVQPFFDAFLDKMMEETIANKDKRHPFASLVIYVRKFIHRNKADEKFWHPFIAQINEAVACDNTERVCRIAFDIVEAIAKPKPEQPKQPTPQPEQGEGKEQGEETTESDAGTGTGNGDQERKEKAEFEHLDANGCTTAIRKALEKVIGEALNLCEQSARDEYDSILEEISDGGIQEYACGNEQAASQQLTEILRSLLTDTQRARQSQSREGALNSLALPKALTTRRCFQTQDEGKAKPHVALLLDCSGSMNCRSVALSKAARILNGSLRASGIDTLTLAFGIRHDGSDNGTVKMSAVPTDGLPCRGGTPTGDALAKANDWLEAQNAQRGLIIVVTDGGPNDWTQVNEERTRANLNGAFVLGVAVETDLAIVQSQCNAAINLPNVAELPTALEPVLTDYINGTMIQ